jgi:copper chaperone
MSECRTVEFSTTGLKEKIMFELQVSGMSCNHCINAVTKSVQEVDHDAKVDINLAEQKVLVNSSAPLERIKSAVEEAGYPVRASATV